jgi:hypothetical protein
MNDVGVAPAVLTAPVSQLPDFLPALAANASQNAGAAGNGRR